MIPKTPEEQFTTEMTAFYAALAGKHGFGFIATNLAECDYITGGEGIGNESNTYECMGCANQSCNIRGRQYEYGFGGILARENGDSEIRMGFGYFDELSESKFLLTLTLNFDILGEKYPNRDNRYSSNLVSARAYHREIGRLKEIEKILSREFEKNDPVLMIISEEDPALSFGYQIPAKDAKDVAGLDRLLGLVAEYFAS